MRNRFFLAVAVILGALSGNLALGQSNPNNPNAQIIQGPGPSGNEGYPINVSPAAGGAAFPITGAVTATIPTPLPVSQDPTSNPWVTGGQFWDGAVWRNWPSCLSLTFLPSQYPGTGLMAFSPCDNAMLALWTACSDGLAGRNLLAQGACLYDPSQSSWVRERAVAIFTPLNAVSVGSETTIWTPDAGYRFRLMGYHLACSVTGNVILRDGAGGPIIDVIPCVAGVPTVVDLRQGITGAAVNDVLTATGPALSTLSGQLEGTQER